MNSMSPGQVAQRLTEDRGLTARKKEEIDSTKRKEAVTRYGLLSYKRS